MKNIAIIALVAGIFWACTPNPSTPEGLLRMYINDVTTKKVDKDYYLRWTTGNLLESVEAMDDEELTSRSYLENVRKTKVKVLNQNCQEEKCVLTYVVSYDTAEKSENESEKVAFSSETKKLAEFHREGDEWKIASVTNLKTFIEAKEPISPLED